MKKLQLLVIAFVCCMFSSGCVTGRRVVSLSVPNTTGPSLSKGRIFLGSVKDGRIFENKPSQPSIPSIKGDALSLSEKQRDSFIGRQRNGYGKALGDMVLPDGESVTKTARRLVEEGLRHRGYTITQEATRQNSASVVVDEFWAWFTPGFFSVSFEARVWCTITVNHDGTTKTFAVKGYGRNNGQVASDANWQLAYKRAFEDFLPKLDDELTNAGL
jgi:hypothetical protein